MRGLTFAAALVIPTVALAQEATFEILSARGGIKLHAATSCSFDGTVVSGVVTTLGINCDAEAYIWDESTGMILVQDPTCGFNGFGPLQMSPNGAAMVSTYESANDMGYTPYRAYRWTAASGVTDLDPFNPGEDPIREAGSFGLAAADSQTVGYSRAEGIVYMTAWAGTSPRQLDWPGMIDANTDLEIHGAAVSADGSVVVVSCNGTDTDLVPLTFNKVVWENDTPSTLPDLYAGQIATVNGMSSNGRLIIGQTFNPSTQEWRGVLWEKESGAWTASMVEPEGFRPTHISDCGTRMLGLRPGQQTLVTKGFEADVQQHILAETGIDTNVYAQFSVSDLSSDGSTMVGYLVDSRGNIKSWRFRGECTIDTDGDGLLDCWETDGIPYLDEDGEAAYFVLDSDNDGNTDADPMHKDLFLEMDSFPGRMLIDAEEIDPVRAAFEDSPVANPDFNFGVTLHVITDDSAISISDVPSEWDMGSEGWPANYKAVRENWFGAPAERTKRDAGSEILEAKAKAFRYVVIANRIFWIDQDTGAREYLMGIAESIPSDDFIVAGGDPLHVNGAGVDVAATLMHEFGHTLGLGHGGGDDINGKPNYPSLMNYVFADRYTWSASFWTLDFSRVEMDTLHESGLDEPVGFDGQGQYDNWKAPYGAYNTQTDKRDKYFAPLDGTPVDFGNSTIDNDALNDDKSETGVGQDLNFVGTDNPINGMETPSFGQPLPGHDDWSNLSYPVEDGDGDPAGRRPRDELTEEVVNWIEATFTGENPQTCSADLNNDGFLDSGDISAFVALFLAGDLAADLNNDGFLDSGDISTFVDAFLAGC